MGDLQRINVATATVAARCPRCRHDFEATLVLLEDHAPPAPPILRPCDACLDAAEAACLAKLAKMPAPTYRDVAPAQRVDDE